MKKHITALGLACLTLAGCSGTSSSAPTPTPDETCTHPLEGESTSVNARELAFCEAESIGKIEGYVQEDYLNDQLVSTSRVNIKPLAVEIKTQPEDSGQWMILVAGKAYSHINNDWVEARPDSDSAELQAAAGLPDRFEALLNPKIRAAGTDKTLTYTVDGTEEVNGVDTTKLVLELDDPQNPDVHYTNHKWISANYIVMKSMTVTSSTTGDSTTSRMSILTTVDKPQDIPNPLFGK